MKELWFLALIWGLLATHLALFMPLTMTLVSWVKNVHYWLFEWKMVEESAEVCASQLGSTLRPSSAQTLLSFGGNSGAVWFGDPIAIELLARKCTFRSYKWTKLGLILNSQLFSSYRFNFIVLFSNVSQLYGEGISEKLLLDYLKK